MKKVFFAQMLFFFVACTHAPKLDESALEESRVYLMQFNVENLFDTKHDPGKDDFAFLPLNQKKTRSHLEFCEKIKVKSWKDECLYKDWTEEKLKEKLNRLAGAILQFNPGKGPDVLFLEEVENRQVLERLNTEFLGGLYKEIILIEGDDKRGIDVAIMSKLPLHRKPLLHKIPFKFDDPKRAEDTRGILEADLRLPDGSLMIAFALHLPNPMHPAVLRTQALNYLNELAKPYQGLRYVVAAGDFNIIPEENLAEKRTEQMSKDWLVGHAVGCQGCAGTYYYRPTKSWSLLDWMLFSKNLDGQPENGWFLDKDSIQVLKDYGRQVDEQGHPVSFEDPAQPLGVSDHLPVGAILKTRKSLTQ